MSIGQIVRVGGTFVNHGPTSRSILLTTNTEEHDHGAIQPHHVLVQQSANSHSQFCSLHCSNLIDHEAARGPQSVAFCRLDWKPEQWSVSGIRGERTHGNRVDCIEPIILKDQGWPCFAGIVRATGNRPNLAAFHSSSR